MLARTTLSRLTSPKASQFSNIAAKAGETEDKDGGSFVRKAVSFILASSMGYPEFSCKGGSPPAHSVFVAHRAPHSSVPWALSALDDLAIYHACSSQAMEKAAKNLAIKDALGEPIVSGPRGSGIVQLKAVRDEDDAWFSFLRPRNWEVLIMEALLHVPGNKEKQQTFRISVADELLPPPSKECMGCPLLGVASIESEKSLAMFRKVGMPQYLSMLWSLIW